METDKKILLWINLLGGSAVLGSYAWGLAAHPGQGNALWGSVPQALRTLSYATMPLAILGYIAFTLYLFIGVDLGTAQIKLKAGFKAFHVLYALILLPSALWMPATFAYIAQPNNLLWLADRLLLFVVGLVGLGLLSALLNIQPRQPAWAFQLAIAGCIFFCIQTALMDAFIWTNYFLP